MNVTREDYLRAVEIFENRRGRRAWRWPALAVAVALIALVVWEWVTDQSAASSGKLLLRLVCFALSGWILLAPYGASNRAGRDADAYLALLGDCALSVTADGIVLSGACTFTYDFGRMLEMIEAPDMLVLVVEPRRFIVVPKRAIDEAQLHALRHGCARKTSKAR